MWWAPDFDCFNNRSVPEEIEVQCFDWPQLSCLSLTHPPVPFFFVCAEAEAEAATGGGGGGKADDEDLDLDDDFGDEW